MVIKDDGGLKDAGTHTEQARALLERAGQDGEGSREALVTKAREHLATALIACGGDPFLLLDDWHPGTEEPPERGYYITLNSLSPYMSIEHFSPVSFKPGDQSRNLGACWSGGGRVIFWRPRPTIPAEAKQLWRETLGWKDEE